MELKTQLHIAHAINYIEKDIADKLIDECDQIASMLTGLSNHLKKSVGRK